MRANEVLKAALGHMEDRAATYDKPEGERSMPATVSAFNALTGHQLTAEQGWLFMTVLKLCRTQQGGFRADNYEDGAAYFALMGEQASGDRNPVDIFVAALNAAGELSSVENRSEGYGPCDIDGWRNWDGKLDAPQGRVEIRNREGKTWISDSFTFDWRRDERMRPSDIVEWRWVKEEVTDPYGPRDAEGWYTWNGDETMRPAGRVDVMLRDCEDVHTWNSDSIRWAHCPATPDGDVVKWRPAQ